MAHKFSPRVRPVRFVFYDDLDTVRFGRSVPEKLASLHGLGAMGSVMLGLVVDDVAPILSQAQAHDNGPLLQLIAADGDRASRDDRLAFLQLIRAGLIKVGIVERGLDDSPPDGERYTLLNVFRTSLRNPAFVLSGWPELNDPPLRAEVLSCLDRDQRQLSSLTDPHLEARIDGLLELDRNLRQTPGAVKRVVAPPGDPLDARVMNVVGALGSAQESVRTAASVISEHARRDTTNLRSRSNWYRLIEEHQQDAGTAFAPAFAALRDIVDSSYNMQVSESLNDDGMSLSLTNGIIASSLAERLTPGRAPGRTLVDERPAAEQGTLRWSDIPALLDELQVLSPEARVRELEKRRIETVAVYKTEHGCVSSIRLAVPWTAVSTAVTMAGGLVTGAPPDRAAIAAALTGVVTLVSGTPIARAFTRRSRAREEERVKHSEQERNAIRVGAAGWLDRIRPGA